MAMAPYKSTSNTLGSYDTFTELDMMKERMAKESAHLKAQMQQMQVEMQQQMMYPMYQQQAPSQVTYDPKTGSYHVERQLSMTRDEFEKYTGQREPRVTDSGICLKCGDKSHLGSYCKDHVSHKSIAGYVPSGSSSTSTIATNSYERTCKSCGEKEHRRPVGVGRDCDRTIGLKKQKQIQNFRKLYWHRRMMNPELFEKTS